MSLSQQASAVYSAYRIAAGGEKLPSPASSAGKYLAEQLRQASNTLRLMEQKDGKG